MRVLEFDMFGEKRVVFRVISNNFSFATKSDTLFMFHIHNESTVCVPFGPSMVFSGSI